jgi:hypothetical protein
MAGTSLLAKLGNRQGLPPCCCSPEARSAQPKKNSRRADDHAHIDSDNEAGSGLWKFKEFSMTVQIPLAGPEFLKATVPGNSTRPRASEPLRPTQLLQVIVPQWLGSPNLAASFRTNSRTDSSSF